MLERSAIAAEEQRGRAMGLPRSVYSDAGEFVKCPSVVGVTFPEILGRFPPSPDRDLNLCRGSTNADSDSTALEQVLKLEEPSRQLHHNHHLLDYIASQVEMLSRRIGYLTSSRHFSALIRPHIVPSSAPSLFRNYALSRFDRENYRPGGGRARPNLPRREIRDQDRQENQIPNASKPEEKEDANFDIWDASQRPPSSNPEEGLMKLLLGNSKLVVTR